MNRIEKYFPSDEPKSEHGYDCDCDGCANCQPQQIERLVAMPLEALVKRDQAMYDAGRSEADQVAHAVITGLQRANQARIEAAYQEGKNVAHLLWLVAAAWVVGVTAIVRWLGEWLL